MAGVRQHIIPQFLQKGFASRINGKNTFVWAFRKDAEVFEANTDKLFLGKNFYGKEGEENYADGIITDLEKKFSSLVNNLRMSEGSVNNSRFEIADFIANLIIRTKFIRDTFVENIKYLNEGLSQHLSDGENISNLLSNPQMVDSEIKKILQSQEVDDILNNSNLENIQELKEILPDLLNIMLPDLIENNLDSISGLFQTSFEKTDEIIPESIKKGHIESLKQNPNPNWIVDICKNLDWYIQTANLSVILGDTGCVFEVKGERRYKPVGEKFDEIVNIFLPISSSKILIGTSHKDLSKIEINNINEIIAKCSFEQFISSEFTPEKKILKKLIGDWSEIMSSDEMEKLRKEMIDDIANFNVSSEKNDK